MRSPVAVPRSATLIMSAFMVAAFSADSGVSHEFHDLQSALEDARAWAEAAPRRAVLVTGSITMIGDTLVLAEEQGWKR